MKEDDSCLILYNCVLLSCDSFNKKTTQVIIFEFGLIFLRAIYEGDCINGNQYNDLNEMF